MIYDKIKQCTGGVRVLGRVYTAHAQLFTDAGSGMSERVSAARKAKGENPIYSVSVCTVTGGGCYKA